MIAKFFEFVEQVFEATKTLLEKNCEKCGLQCDCLPDCPCCGYPNCGHDHDKFGQPKTCCSDYADDSRGEYRETYADSKVNQEQISAQGLFDVFKFTDKEVIDKIVEVVKSIDVEKLKALMKLVNIKDNTLHIEFDLKLQNKE
jgi:hypothetical protein